MVASLFCSLVVSNIAVQGSDVPSSQLVVDLYNNNINKAVRTCMLRLSVTRSLYVQIITGYAASMIYIDYIDSVLHELVDCHIRRNE